MIDGPRSVNAVAGETVQFNCVVGFSGEGTVDIKFSVNNISISDLTIRADFNESELFGFPNSAKRSLTLTANALLQYNNAEVLCIGLNYVGGELFSAFSEVAILLVKGMFIVLHILHSTCSILMI